MAKKVTPAKQAMSKGDSQASKESDSDQLRQQAAALTKKAGRGGFDDYPRLDDGTWARLSHEGWPTLQQSVPLAGHKRTVVSSQSPKKTDAKVAQQVQVQHRLTQQALQPALARVFLPSASVGALRPLKMTERSVAAGNSERERLNEETRASQALYTEFGGIAGTMRAVLMQPA